MSRKEPKTLRVACFKDEPYKIIMFIRGADWWGRSEDTYPFLAALESHRRKTELLKASKVGST